MQKQFSSEVERILSSEFSKEIITKLLNEKSYESYSIVEDDQKIELIKKTPGTVFGEYVEVLVSNYKFDTKQEEFVNAVTCGELDSKQILELLTKHQSGLYRFDGQRVFKTQVGLFYNSEIDISESTKKNLKVLKEATKDLKDVTNELILLKYSINQCVKNHKKFIQLKAACFENRTNEDDPEVKTLSNSPAFKNHLSRAVAEVQDQEKQQVTQSL